MSKSRDNDIGLSDSPEVVWKKLSTAVTDTARVRRNDPGNPERCNLFSYHRFFSSEEEISRVDTECRSADIGCFDCKKILAENISRTLEPIQKRRAELAEDPAHVWEVLREGAKRLIPVAKETLVETKRAMGIV